MKRCLAMLICLGWLLAGCGRLAAPVVIEWSTETEVDTVGFNLYRSESPDGPFKRVNDELIPASPDPLAGGHYAYTDTNVIAGRTYYYELEDVESTGKTTRHGPIKVTAQVRWPRWAWAVVGVTTALAVAVWRSRRPKP